ncbi:hypothetical protein KM043_011916 [Ampulex compressa]|nr:hypothetical protein KM043_011916 [Ampulex compressa]
MTNQFLRSITSAGKRFIARLLPHLSAHPFARVATQFADGRITLLMRHFVQRDETTPWLQIPQLEGAPFNERASTNQIEEQRVACCLRALLMGTMKSAPGDTLEDTIVSHPISKESYRGVSRKVTTQFPSGIHIHTSYRMGV